MGLGWGTVAGFLVDLFGSRKERISNNIEKLKREMNEILKKPQNPRRTARYERLARKLRELEQQAKNN